MANGKWQMWRKDGTLNQRTGRSSNIFHFPFSIFHEPAFTLVEMLTVIVIIVLIIGLALPVFRSLNGSRSQEGATNTIAAMLGRARAAAIGVQAPRGVVFYIDAATGQTAMALVQPEITVNTQTWSGSINYTKGSYVSYTGLYYVAKNDTQANIVNTPAADTADWYPADVNAIDEITDTNAEFLPLGVGAQLVNDWGLATVGTGGTNKLPTTDAYVSTGAIMFDASGRLASTTISITQQGTIGQAMGMAATGSYNIPNWKGTTGTINSATPNTTAGVPLYLYSGVTAPYVAYGNLFSAFGIVVYDRDAFTAQNFDTIDPVYEPGISPKSGSYTSGTPSEQTEEQWLDQNATPLLINRYNGTLIRAQ